jgi:hypothetical protein
MILCGCVEFSKRAFGAAMNLPRSTAGSMTSPVQFLNLSENNQHRKRSASNGDDEILIEHQLLSRAGVKKESRMVTSAL